VGRFCFAGASPVDSKRYCKRLGAQKKELFKKSTPDRFAGCHHLPPSSILESVKKSPRATLSAAAVSLLLLVAAGSAFNCRADIQDPPYLDHGPIRKLSRGLSNLMFGSTEVIITLDSKNSLHGNSGMVYGLVSGLGRTLMRIGAGFYEVVTFPAPTFRQSYAPLLPSTVPWVQGGYEEFPPELGFESRFNYNRSGGPTTRMP
jgi:putative exosortase-associated protein (TIGR04073 family)